jgi:hypothetical protein
MNEIIVTKITADTSAPCEVDNTKMFGIILSEVASIIHLVHWYIPDINIHTLMGDLYSDLNDLFDKLQEEIIGTSRKFQTPFPSFSCDCFDSKNLSQYESKEDLIDTYHKTTVKLTAILNSPEFKMYIDSVCSGLNNTKEDIVSRINKTDYLLSLMGI